MDVPETVPPTVVFIRWRDSHLKFGTLDSQEMNAMHPLIMSTAGILHHQNEEEIVICHDTHVSDGESYYRVAEAISMQDVVSIQVWQPAPAGSAVDG